MKNQHNTIVWSLLSTMISILFFAIPQHTTCILSFTLNKNTSGGFKINGLQNSLSKLQSSTSVEEFQALPKRYAMFDVDKEPL